MPPTKNKKKRQQLMNARSVMLDNKRQKNDVDLCEPAVRNPQMNASK
jgi:hypothetical protein